MQKIATTIFVFVFLIVPVSTVYAIPEEVPANLDAKHNSMALAGSAIVTGGTAVAVNPAGLGNVDNISATANGNLMMMSLQAPANGPLTESSFFGLAPLFYVGGGFRLHEMVVVGLNAYMPAGAGASYEDVDFSGYGLEGLEPKDWTGALFIFEMGPAIAFNFPYHIKFGAGYRINYFGQSFSGYNRFPSLPDIPLDSSQVAADTDLSMSGWGFTGFRVGLQWDPIEVFHVGISYRSPVKVDLEGESTLTAYSPALAPLLGMDPTGSLATLEADVACTVNYADKLSVGLGYDVIPKKVSLLFDYDLDLYKRHAKSTITTMTLHDAEVLGIPLPGEIEAESVERFSDRHTFRLGGEVWPIEPLAVRAGFALQTQAKSKKYMNPSISGAPAVAYIAALGGGYQIIDSVRVDIGYTFLFNGDDVPADLDDLAPSAVPGEYSSIVHHVSLGAEFEIE